MFRGYLTPAMSGCMCAVMYAASGARSDADVRIVADETIDAGEADLDPALFQLPRDYQVSSADTYGN